MNRFPLFLLLLMILGPAGGCGRTPPAAPSAQTINLNTATVDELAVLPRLGPGTAGRIVAYREAHGNFTTIDQLLEIRGIDHTTLSAVRPLLAISDGETAQIDVNTATVEELVALPGVGRSTAAYIIAHRQKYGPFRSPDEIASVHGVSRESYAQLRPYVTVADQ